jgi:hypothetical protein
MAFFDIVLQTESSLHPDGEPSDLISEYRGIIRYAREWDNKVFRVGKVKAHRIHADLARQNGESIFDVCDAHSQEMHEIYAALFDPAEDDFKDSVRSQFDGFDLDILVLDYVLLHPRWRGLKLGLLAARKMIDLLGGGCGLTVSYICPLNPNAEEMRKVPASWIPRHRNRDEVRTAKGKLRSYFQRMGFQRIGRTRFHGLSMARVTPTLADLLRPAQ